MVAKRGNWMPWNWSYKLEVAVNCLLQVLGIKALYGHFPKGPPTSSSYRWSLLPQFPPGLLHCTPSLLFGGSLLTLAKSSHKVTVRKTWTCVQLLHSICRILQTVHSNYSCKVEHHETLRTYETIHNSTGRVWDYTVGQS